MAPKDTKGGSSKTIKPTGERFNVTSSTTKSSITPSTTSHSAQYYINLKCEKGLLALTTSEQTAYALSVFFVNSAWKAWNEDAQKEFWKTLRDRGIDAYGEQDQDAGGEARDAKGSSGALAEEESAKQELQRGREREIKALEKQSRRFRERRDNFGIATGAEELQDEGKNSERAVTGEDIDSERNRRKLLGHLRGKKMGKYEMDPEWDDVVPIPQDDGEGALAQIAYTDEYAEATSYLRAIMSINELTPRVLNLTAHIISLNPAHYTVWLYRFSTLVALCSSLTDELTWLNTVSMNNPKNYQIWHHRQQLMNALYPSISDSPSSTSTLAKSESEFMRQMLEHDSKNYHVWSYRQYLVRKIGLWNEDELRYIEELLDQDVRNNSAWSHRFFVVFEDPKVHTGGVRATEKDERVPKELVDREVAFTKSKIELAPQNQSSWNYLKGVLRKGGRAVASEKEFMQTFVKLDGEGSEVVKSSHALDLLAEIYAEEGGMESAGRMLGLLGDKYDRIRKNYWEWRKALLDAEVGENKGMVSGVSVP